MSNIFFAADHHFYHRGILGKTAPDGVSPLREFSDVENMNEYMVDKHNSVVRDCDTVYFLGDFSLTKSPEKLAIAHRLKGRKILVLGNHDLASSLRYLEYFWEVKALVELAGMVCTHVPLHPQSLTRWTHNIHGHLHANRVRLAGEPDPRYFCVSVEQIDYVPISLEQIKLRF